MILAKFFGRSTPPYGKTAHLVDSTDLEPCLTLSQRDVALRRGVHVQSLRMHPRAVKKGSEVPPYLPSQSLRAVKELLPLSPYLLGYIRSRLSSLRSYSGPFSGDQLFWLCVSCRGQRRAYLMTQRESKRVLCAVLPTRQVARDSRQTTRDSATK